MSRTWTWIALAGLMACGDTDDFDEDGFVEPADCNDNNADVYPGAPEIPYDRIDQDCDGADINDVDEDGFIAEEAGGDDCNDFRARVNPEADEIPYDGIDQNCDGWNDDDFDQDGYIAQSEGGDDCDDFDPEVVPLDLDNDGFSPCTGDCDESDPDRNPGAKAVCGNDLEDNCDGVSDCALTGFGTLDEADLQITGVFSNPKALAAYEFGRSLAVADVTGDEVDDLVVGGFLEPDGSVGRVWWFDGPLDAVNNLDDASAIGLVDGRRLRVLAAGDVDGDDRGDVALSALPNTGGAVVGVFVAPQSGDVDFGSGWWRMFEPTGGDIRMGERLAVLGGGARLAVSAKSDGCSVLPGSSCGTVNVVPLTKGARVGYGDTGALLEGAPSARAGQQLHAFDADGDGEDDLLVGEDGYDALVPAFARIVPSPPTSGVHLLEDVASASIDLREWGDGVGGAATGDLDGDGAQDLALGAPRYNVRSGAVAVFTEPLAGEVDPASAPIQRFAFGQDSFGGEVEVTDFDGDGQDDLIIGAPAALGAGGKGEPGSLMVWYGPLQPGSELTVEADLFLEGLGGERTEGGAAIEAMDFDDDGLTDILVSSPGEGPGIVYGFRGGATAINGI